MKITLSNVLLDSLHTAHVRYIPPDMHQWFHLNSGKEHYRLLMHISYCFDNATICDIGTYRGASAIALSENTKNKIFSLDIGNFRPEIPISNIEFYIGDFHTDEKVQSTMLSSPFIFLDIDHLYNNEIWIYNFLKKNNWKGLMICDDIYLNDEMKKFWEEITHPKIDITQYGHFSGTGAVLFGNDTEFNMI